MLEIRKSADRGQVNHGWLKTRHTFSFATYNDPRYIRFRSLRVLNEDHIAPRKGFDTHPHENMEIISYVVKGAMTHRDSLGNNLVIRPGDVQRMTAGTGLTHSEFNEEDEEPVHLLQIWITPDREGLRPECEQKHFSQSSRTNQLRMIVSPDGWDSSCRINQDALIFASSLNHGHRLEYHLGTGRYVWVQLIDGSLKIGDQKVERGDGVAIGETSDIEIVADELSEFLLFDLA